MAEPTVCYLGGPGQFEFVVESLPAKSGAWRISIRGERSEKITEVLEEELVEYANCGVNLEAIKTYICRYGPLDVLQGGQGEFLWVFTQLRWKEMQFELRESWDRCLEIALRNASSKIPPSDLPDLWDIQNDGKIVELNGKFYPMDRGPVVLADSHYKALLIKLLNVWPTGKLRKCLNPSCPRTPYFVASHGKMLYCSEPCKGWGQRQAKLKYWRENKQGRGKESKPDTE